MTIAYGLSHQRDHILKNKKSQKDIIKDLWTQHFSWTACFEDKIFNRGFEKRASDKLLVNGYHILFT